MLTSSRSINRNKYTDIKIKNVWGVKLKALINRTVFRDLLVVYLVLLLSGCMTNSALDSVEYGSSDPLMPVNLRVNGQPADYQAQGSVMGFLSYAVTYSNQFHYVDKANQTYPYSIEIEYGWSNQFSPFSLVSMLVSAGTVLIVPGYTNEEHTMNVSIFHNGEEVEKMSYSYDTKAILALWHNSNEARKSVVGKMVGMMLDDIQRKQLIPVFDVSKQRAGVMINDF